jgi:hypothetical protein
MSEQANIGEVRVVGELRGKVVDTAETLSRIVDDCNSTMQRFVDWVVRDRAAHWKNQLRKRDQKLQSARSDLERAKIAKPDADPRTFTDYIRALKKAKAALDEANAKKVACRRWGTELQRQALLLRAGLRPVATMADAELPMANHWLQALEQHLAGYLTQRPAMPDELQLEGDDAPDLPSRGRGGAAMPNESDDAS